MNRIMLAGTHSGCGKTTVTCALLQAIKNRGMKVSAFKCGPDYIDPMFHKTVIGADTYNLDSYLMSVDTINYLLKKNSSEMNIIEGVMGFYDGLSFTERASSYELSQITNTPVILIVNSRGKALSAIAEIKGFKDFLPNKIAGVIFNNLPERLYEDMSRMCERINIQPLGFMPHLKNTEIKSRHLGLITADEIGDIKHKISLLAEQAEKTVDIDRIIELSNVGDTKDVFPYTGKIADVTIAAAHDRAFCFYYEDNFKLLRTLGAEIKFFSPLKNEPVPECDGLILCGGYPELYAHELSRNTVTLNSVSQKIKSGIPCIAECGGFMYLHKELSDINGKSFKMAGIIDGKCVKTDRLVRFGYMEMTANTDNILCKRGHKIRSREFHYFDSNCCGNGFIAEKNCKKYPCVHTEGNLFAGFPHIHFYSDISLAKNFIEKCKEYQCTRLKK